MLTRSLLFALLVVLSACQPRNTPPAQMHDSKIIIYQMMTRLFGNTNTTNHYYGSIEQNGVGKFNDITDTALIALRNMGITHVWYTGVIEHALMTDYTAHGIPLDDPDVVKGRAGSAYAIKDYYDVNPDMAVDVPHRMQEFEALLRRTQAQGLKVIIDFVPNHVARSYQGDATPAGVRKLGHTDDTNQAFSPNNNFYYLPGQSFVVPRGYVAGGKDFGNALKDGRFAETPAKVTGNNVFTATPTEHDWFETIKLNYGVDYAHQRQEHFTPIPSTWTQMTDILLFWAGKGIDGFRCDMCEMVPVAFWDYAIGQVHSQYPHVLFVGEAYNQQHYATYVHDARFDVLYDKVGLYDSLKAVIRGTATTQAIHHAVYNPNTQGIEGNMLHFLENHDEQRLASPYFAGSPQRGLSMMVLSATLSTGPVMIYFGQEVGATGAGNEGFGTDDGRTTMFDYWAVPEFAAWVNQHRYDGGALTPTQKELRAFYSRLLQAAGSEPAIVSGALYPLQPHYRQLAQYPYSRCYSFARYTTDGQLILVLNSFVPDQAVQAPFFVPAELAQAVQLDSAATYTMTDLLDPTYTRTLTGTLLTQGVEVRLAPCNSRMLKIEKVEK